MRLHSRHRWSSLALLIACWTAVSSAAPAWADTTPQTLPFVQSWTNASLVTTDDDWSGAPGIIGIRGDGLTATPGVDPQTIVNEQLTIDVMANQSNPNLNASGGVAEFDGIANPAIALQGSGTADAPYIQITVNTTGVSFVRVAYTLRDIDGSLDNAVQPVALQYRLGTTGNFTNVPAAFVLDATTGPNQATLTTSVSVVLPAGAANQPVLQLRVITANAAGNDEWVAIDDISITNATTSPSGTGVADPSAVAAGGSTLVQVAVVPGGFPTSTGLAVSCDMRTIGGLVDQALYDDGTNGDVTAGDNRFSYLATVAMETAAGNKSMQAVISDAQARSGEAEVQLTVTGAAGVTKSLLPASLRALSPFPNPFRVSTSIVFELAEPAHTRVMVFDLHGRLVATLDDASIEAGRHEVIWTGMDSAGRHCPVGLYVCRITAGRDVALRRMILLR